MPAFLCLMRDTLFLHQRQHQKQRDVVISQAGFCELHKLFNCANMYTILSVVPNVSTPSYQRNAVKDISKLINSGVVSPIFSIQYSQVVKKSVTNIQRGNFPPQILLILKICQSLYSEVRLKVTHF